MVIPWWWSLLAPRYFWWFGQNLQWLLGEWTPEEQKYLTLTHSCHLRYPSVHQPSYSNTAPAKNRLQEVCGAAILTNESKPPESENSFCCVHNRLCSFCRSSFFPNFFPQNSHFSLRVFIQFWPQLLKLLEKTNLLSGCGLSRSPVGLAYFSAPSLLKPLEG